MSTQPSKFEPTWASLEQYQIPDWYQDGKFGIFIHWGPYCVPAFGNEWYPRNMYLQNTREYVYHQKVYGHQSRFGYKDFIPMFRAEKFDPERGWICFAGPARNSSCRWPNITTASRCTIAR